jgi:predicted RecA/RadA family phage recombinase
MALRDIADAQTGDVVHSGMSVPMNRHGSEIAEGDRIEFDANVSTYDGKTVITKSRDFRRISNY